MKGRFRFWRRRWFRVVVGIVVVLGVFRLTRKYLLSKPARPDAETFAQAQRVKIVRDTYGVPHIHGKSDADAAFGLAYAHAEDDFPLIQGVLAAGTGRLSLLKLSREALANDFYVGLVRAREQVAEGYDSLSPEYRAVLEGYARGVNLYAYLHPSEADGRIFPISGRDIAAGFAHKIPLMFDMNKVLGALNSGPPKHAGEKLLLTSSEREASAFPGSNAHAVSAARSTDGTTRLNINSHQPWEGPVAWYEVQITSDEGWNMTGGLFPGAPIVLHGHNDHLGWAHTVNNPDLVDVYELTLDASKPEHYMLDGQLLALETREAPITIDTGFFDLTVHKTVYWSEHGPVMKTEKGAWAIRYAGIGRAIKSGEQWYRMNKAKSFEVWKEAMREAAIPMFNTVYADKDHIAYFYNALLPIRAEGHDWQSVLPGNQRALIWNKYLPFDELPQVVDPPTGFVQTCNATPWRTTSDDAANPKKENYSATFGIETNLTNRSARSLALFGDSTMKPISREDFLRFKWDRTYGPDSELMREVVRPLVAMKPSTRAETEALDLLQHWSGVVDETQAATTIAILTWRRYRPDHAGGSAAPRDVETAFHDAVRWLLDNYGKVGVPWNELQRLRRGATVDLPLGGAPDVLNAVNAKDAADAQDHHIIGRQGDSLVVIAEFKEGTPTKSDSIHQYGASSRAGTAHFADQAPLFIKQNLKPTWRTAAEQSAHKEREYHPGE